MVMREQPQASDVWARLRLADVWLRQSSAYGYCFLFSCPLSVPSVFISEQNAAAVQRHFSDSMDIETLDGYMLSAMQKKIIIPPLYFFYHY